MCPSTEILTGSDGGAAAATASTSSPPVGAADFRRRVLLVDDHPMMRGGMTLLINHSLDLSVCAEAGSAAEALLRIADSKPDLVVLDLTLPDRNGIDLLQELKASYPSLPVLVVSMHDEMLYAERCLRAGARGYLMKEAGGERMVEAIREILTGRVAVSPAVSASLLGGLSRSARPKARTPVETLTDRELQVFRLIGGGLNTRKIAERLGLSPKTVDVHRANIKEKLGLRDVHELIRQAVCWVEDSGAVERRRRGKGS